MFAKPIRFLMHLGAAGALVSCLAASPELPEPGSRAPQIEASTWYNHVGRTPSLASLEGKAILIEFWATW